MLAGSGEGESVPGISGWSARRGVQETAEMILTFALSFEGEPRDDMTVLVGGIYG